MESTSRFTVSSTFAGGDRIPRTYGCDGRSISPPLRWENPSEASRSFAVVAYDLDESPANRIHWALYNVPAATRRLPQALSAEPQLVGVGTNGRNSRGGLGYRAPCPTDRPHRYLFRVYALDTSLDLPAGVREAELRTAMSGHILAQADLQGVYARQPTADPFRWRPRGKN
jgi:Raf kinase inhibitor-like YbhB/YbcL family protein